MENEFKLTDDIRAQLINAHRHETNKRYADRIKAILLLADGFTKSDVQRILLIDRGSVDRYLKEYCRGGLKKLLDDDYTDYCGRLTEEQKNQLRQTLNSHLFSTAAEVCIHVKKEFHVEYKHASMVKFLHRLGFVYKKTKGVPGKADRVKQENFVKEYKNLKENLKNDEKIYFLDAVHPVHNNTPDYAWIEKGKEREVKTNSSRDRVNINGLYSPNDHETIVRADITINAESTLKLIQMAVAKHPELSRIYIIHDNARANIARELRNNLPDKINMIPLPSYSPNLNLIERLWKYMRKNVMNNKYHETFENFKTALFNFFRSLRYRKKDLEFLMAENFHIY